MHTPLLASIASPSPRIRASVGELPELPFHPGLSWFVVAEAGRFGDANWRRGEVLLCRGEARPGDTVVLVARGHGRPRLGRLDGLRFVGDQGEPCHPARWSSAGPIVGAVRRRLGAWVVDLDGAPVRRRSVRRVHPPSPAQLRLPFQATAAPFGAAPRQLLGQAAPI